MTLTEERKAIGKTFYQIEGITCLDCAQKFEKAVGELPGVTAASLNTMTGKLTVEGAADLAAIQRLGQEENYTVAPVVTSPKKTAVYQVEGITCLDCAQKFEQAVGELSGVTAASLNTMTGKLTVEGAADLAAVQRLGQEENYTVALVVTSPWDTRGRFVLFPCPIKDEERHGYLTSFWLRFHNHVRYIRRLYSFFRDKSKIKALKSLKKQPSKAFLAMEALDGCFNIVAYLRTFYCLLGLLDRPTLKVTI